MGANVSIRLSLQDAETVRAGLEKLGTDGAAALKKIEAAASNPSQGLSAIDKTMAGLKSRVEDTAQSIGPLGTLLTGLGPIGLVVAAGIGAAVAVIYEMSKAANELGERAKGLVNFADAAGVTTTVMQALTAEGSKFGVSSEQISGGLQRMSINLAEAKRGTGALYEDLYRINPQLAHQVAAAKDVASAYDLIGKAIRDANAAGDSSTAASVARAAFGRNPGGQGLLAADVSGQGGANSLAATYTAAGKTLDDGLLKKLKELNNQIEETNQRAKDIGSSIFAEDVLSRELQAAQAWERMASAARDMANATKGESWGQWFSRNFSGAGAEGGINLDTQKQTEQDLLENSARGRLARLMASRAASGPTPPGGQLDSDTFQGRFAGVDPSASTTKVGDAAKSAQVPIEAVLADTRKWMSMLGSAATPAEQLRLKVLELNVAQKDNSATAQVASRALAAFKDAQTEAATSARERLGLASEEEIYTSDLIRLQKDRADGFIKSDAEMVQAEERLARTAEQTFKQQQVQNSAFKGLAQMGQGNTPQEDLDKLSTSTLNDLGNAIESRIQNPTKKASEAWREFAQQATASIEQVVIKMAILKPMAAGLDNLFTTGSLTGAAGAAGAASPMSGLLGLLGFHFAGGGIMTSGGPIPLRRYAGGGVASSPQLAMFGEGSGAEAYVPLPDGRAIPVQMNGRANGGHTFNTNMNVHMNIPQGTSVEAAHSMTATAARQFRDVVNKAIDDRIVTHLRTGGLMNPA